MKAAIRSVTVLLTLLPLMATAAVDINGDWAIDSSVGGTTPVKVNCTLVQAGADLSGTCTPVMENPEPAKLTGKLEGTTAKWGYDVVFRGNPGKVTFTADSVANDKITGTLSLSGREAPFTALRKK